MACMAAMDSLRAQIRSMTLMTDAQVSAALQSHRQLVTAMLVNMSSHMERMGIAPSPAFTITADSVRGDLDRFDTMSADEVRRAMPAHEARLSRLLQWETAACRKHMNGTCSTGGCCC